MVIDLNNGSQLRALCLQGTHSLVRKRQETGMGSDGMVQEAVRMETGWSHPACDQEALPSGEEISAES